MRPPVKNQQARHSNQRAATKSSPSTPPLVSVIIPCYQAEQYITTAVQSIWAQVNLGQPIEIIAVDDGSTDGTARLLHHLKVQSTIPFFIITHPTNRGVASARQSGVAAARGQFILWQDADDQAHPKRLAMLLAGWYQHEKKLSSPSSANNNPTKLAAIGSGFYIVAGQKIKHGKTPTAFIDANYLPHYLTHHGKAVATDITNYHCQPLAIHFPTLLVRRSLYDQFAYRPWPLAEDHDWLYRLLESGLTVINLPKRLYYYRKHGASLTRRHADKLILGAMVRLSSLCRSLHLPEPLFPLPRGGLSHRSSGSSLHPHPSTAQTINRADLLLFYRPNIYDTLRPALAAELTIILLESIRQIITRPWLAARGLSVIIAIIFLRGEKKAMGKHRRLLLHLLLCRLPTALWPYIFTRRWPHRWP